MQTANQVEIKLSGPQYAILSSQKSRNLFMAGQGGGKTWLMGIVSKYFVEHFPEMNGIIGSNTFGQLSESTLKEIFLVWEIFGWTEYTISNPTGCYVIDKTPPVHFTKPNGTYKTKHNKIFFANGCVVTTVSLENYKVIEGQNQGWAMLDETADTKEEAVTNVITGRLRQEGMYVNTGPDRITNPFVGATSTTAGKAINPLYVFTKPAKVEWLNNFYKLEQFREEITEVIYSDTDFFFKEFSNKCIVICSALHNLENLPEGYIEERIDELLPEEVDRLIYGSPFSKSGAEYYPSFKKIFHVGKYSYVEGLPIHISWDFNSAPYMSLTVHQIIYSGTTIEARAIAEYAFKEPRNNIEDVCDAFVADFGHLLDPGLFYYGDSSGKNAEVFRDAKSCYEVIDIQLQDYLYSSFSRKLLKQNARHNHVANGTLGRRQFINNMLKGKYGVQIKIDESCKYLIADLEYTKVDSNGAKLKKKELIDSKMCEKYGHMSDTLDGFYCFEWGPWAKDKPAK